MNFTFTRLDIPEIILVEARTYSDDRGFFMESYKRSAFAAGGIAANFVQDNLSFSIRRVLRGLHYQRPPHAQAKLVSVLRGEVFDVAVDLRPRSETFGQWVGAVLSADNRKMIYIPEGFAHGFQALSDEALVSYKASAEYAPQSDAGVRWDDPKLAVDWPLNSPLLSEKDARLPSLAQVKDDFAGESATDLSNDAAKAGNAAEAPRSPGEG